MLDINFHYDVNPNLCEKKLLLPCNQSMNNENCHLHEYYVSKQNNCTVYSFVGEKGWIK